MASRIPLCDLRREYEQLRVPVDQAIQRVLNRGWFLLGEETEAFEAEWARHCGASYAVCVGSGTDAISLALQAAGIGPGDEVILPALMPPFSALAVARSGAAPVFVDVDPVRGTLSPAACEAAITPRAAAVMPVHLYGCAADMARIADIAQRHALLLLGDASQAHGARYEDVPVGSLGDGAAFSFYPTRNLGAYGDAGAFTTKDATLAERVRALRHGGQKQAEQHELLGACSRINEIQAAILRAKLPNLDAWNQQRRTLAARYDAGLADCAVMVIPAAGASAESVYARYVVLTPLRDSLRDYLAGTGIQTGIHYPRPVYLEQAFAYLGYQRGACPVAEDLASRVLSLPIFPQLTGREVDQVVRLIRIFFAMR